MKKDVHPAYGPVVFRDRSAGLLLLTRSTLVSRPGSPGGDGQRETVEVGGTRYPVVDVDVSSASHPFWTGRGRVLDTEGRVEKFRRRYARATATGPGAASPDAASPDTASPDTASPGTGRDGEGSGS